MEDSHKQKISEFIQKITGHMHIPCDISFDDTTADKPVTVSIQAHENAKLLIGKEGQNLKALEHLLRAVLSRNDSQARQVSVDVNDYRKEKAAQVVELVRQAAGRVRDTRRSEALPPMSSYERRLVHTELASWSDVATESVGQEPQRRVVIKPL